MLPILVILHGLIALVPSSGGTSPMTALVVATTGASNLPSPPPVCYAQHTASVAVMTPSSQCTAAHCAFSDPLCTCTLNGDDLSLQIVPTPSPSPIMTSPRTPPRALPYSDRQAKDFSYLVNMRFLGQSVDQGYLGTTVTPALATSLAARLQFPFDSVSACDLVTRNVDLADNVYALNFRQIADDPADGELSQAAGQIALATFTPTGTGSQSVVLTLTKFDGSSPRSLTLNPAGTDGYVITLSNERTGNDVFRSPDEPCDDGVGRDFAFFYNLAPAASPTPWSQRQVPHVNYSSAKSFLDLDPGECLLAYKYKTAMSRPICPMATFN